MKKRFPIKIIICALVALILYQLLLSQSGFKPSFAESNYVANQMRLQCMERAPEKLNIVLAGSSISARLTPKIIKNEFRSLNMGIDGSSTLFAANTLLSFNKQPRTLVLELNTIFRNTADNDKALSEGLQSGTNRLSKLVPFVRAESRPVTIIYSLVKSYKDSKLTLDTNIDKQFFVKPVTSYSYKKQHDFKSEKFQELESLIHELRERNINVVLMMLPDGVHDRTREYLIADQMTKKFDVYFLDLKSPLSDLMKYTDGLHLSAPSANFITEVIGRSLQNL